jgi:AsmA protein
VGRLLSDAADMANLSGLGNVGIKATASGDTVGELLNQLQGDAAFDLQQGLYQGVDLWYEIRKARARLKKIESPAVPENPQTELSEFAGTLNFSGGTVNNRDFIAKLPFMRLSGNGSINLLESSLDYDLLARVVETPVFADGDDLDSLRGLVLPIQIKGGIDAPQVSVDIGELAKSAAENKLKERLRKKFGLDEPESQKDTALEQPASDQPSSDQTSSDQLSAEDQLKQDAKDKVKQKLRGLFD